MGVTGQAETFHKEILKFFSEVKAAYEIPVFLPVQGASSHFSFGSS